jgi:class 3 adenylate cyclase/tetratricopeptide (TPR) repeat protein
MQCPRCQQDNPPNAKFCFECGAALAPACASCGTALPAAAKFCPECAHPVAAAAPPAVAPAARFASPEAYTPQHLAEKILTSKTALAGERKLITVLFADLKGSMELLADRDPEEARGILDPVLERMMEAVHRYEGTVNQVMGDGIMALFGAPVAHEDHAVRACYAALRMQEAVKQYAEELHRARGVPLQIRVGLNSGEVIVRSVGSDLRMDYTAVGQTTHLAARMEQMAMPGTILVAPETLGQAEGYVVVTALGERPIKGMSAPVEVYEVTGASTARSRLHASVARGLTRFVGRDVEVDQLRQALERAGAGRGQVVAVVGEPGVGKSRLYWEFIHSHRTQGWLVAESSSVSFGKAMAYLPTIDLLKTYFQIEPRDEARKIREKVTGKLLSLDRSLEPFLPAFLWLLDVPVDEPEWQALEPAQRRQRTLDGIKRLLIRESQIQPVLVVFEDLHWVDAETQALLDGLVESLPTARLLLLVNYRPEYRHGWNGKTYYRQLRIDPLPPESAEALLDALLGEDASLDALKRLLIERTEGNPFFLEESVRTLLETNMLAGERGSYRLTKVQATFQIPATAQAILAARIDRLSPEDKRLLQSASVIGREVPFALLQAIAQDGEEAIRRGLANLQAAEFLYETNLFPDLEYTFKHALTQEVAYKSLPQEKRRTYHEQIARTLEASFPERLDEKLELLAHHYQQSGNVEKALEYLTRAAEKAVARFAADEATRYYEGTIACLDQLPHTEERQRQRIDLRLAEVEVVWTLGRYETGARILEEVQAMAEDLGDLGRLARIHFQSGWYLYDQMDLDRAFAHFQQCHALAEQLGQVERMRHVYWGLGNSCRSLSNDVKTRRAHAIAFHATGLTLAERSYPDVVWWDAHNGHFLWLIYFFQLGEWEPAMAALSRGERLAKALPEGPALANSTVFDVSRGLSDLARGERDASACLESMRASLAAAERTANHVFTAIGHFLLGQGYALMGDLPRALSHFHAVLPLGEQIRLFLPGALAWTAETEARLDDLDAALGHLRSYEGLVARTGEGLAWFPSRGVSDRVYGLVAARRGEPARAAEHFERSIDVLAHHGYRPDLARSYAALGRFQRDQGQPAAARQSLETAIAQFQDMGFGRELEATRAQLA